MKLKLTRILIMVQNNRVVGAVSPFVETTPIPIQGQRAPTSSDTNYPVGQPWVFDDVYYIHVGAGSWQAGGNDPATTSVYGTVILTDNSEPVATKVYVDAQIAAVVVGAVPAATETTAGIAEIATQAETNTGTDDARIVSPLKLKTNLTTPPAIGGTTPNTGAFTTLTATAVGAAIALTSDTASSFGVTGAGIDLTLSSSGGRVVVNGEEAAADAVRILSAAGGLDVDVALQMNLTSSQNAADAVRILASAGGIDVDAVGSAGEDINITNTGGSVYIGATESATDAVVVESTAGGVQILASGASAGEDILLTATGSSIRLVATENVSDSIVLSSTNGGVQILAPGAAAGEDIVVTATGSSVRITSTESATDSINIESTAGGINILASGAAAGEDINLTATGSSVNVNATEDAALAIHLHANGGTSETIRVRADQGTGVASIDVLSDVGGITLTAGLGSADAINIVASDAAGGIDIDSGTAGFIVDTTGAVSLDSAAASNFTVTGAFDLTLNTTAGSVVMTGGEAAVDAIDINASNAAGGIDIDAGTGGITLDSTGAISIDAAAASNLTTSVGDLSLISSAGSVVITGAEAAVDAIDINASNAAGGIDIDAGTGGITIDSTGAISIDAAAASNLTVTGAFDLTVNSTAGALNLTSGEANADSVVITSGGGMDITATGAAGKDIDVVCTSGSMNVTIGENVSDALVINCSGAASGISIDCGTSGVTFGTGIKQAVTAVVTGVDPSPYALLGTDYFVSVDTGAGVMTITLPAAPSTGRTIIVYDAGGAAAGNNITIDGNGKNIAAAGTTAATKTITTAYASMTLTYNGTLWLGQKVT